MDGKSTVLPEPFVGERLDGSGTRAEGAAPFRVGFLAQIVPRKGLAELVRGFLKWVETEPGNDARLLVGGTAVRGAEGYLKDVRRYSELHPHGHRVDFLGQISGATRTRFYEEIHLLAVPSLFESFCLTVLEALWRGRPVLAGPDLGVLEYLAGCRPVRVLPTVTEDVVAAGLAQAHAQRAALAHAAAA